MATENEIFRHLKFYPSSSLVDMNFILICFRLLINLNSTSESSGDYIDNLRSQHITAAAFFDVADNVVYNTTVKLSS